MDEKAKREVATLQQLDTRGRLAAVLQLGERVLDADDGSPGFSKRFAREMGLSASTVQRYVAIASLCRRLGRRRFDHLGVSHLKLVVAAPIARQQALVEKAEAEQWTVTRLRAEIQRWTTAERPQRSGCHVALGRLAGWAADRHRLDGVERLQQMDGDEAVRLLRLVRTIQMELQMVETRLLLAAGPHR